MNPYTSALYQQYKAFRDSSTAFPYMFWNDLPPATSIQLQRMYDREKRVDALLKEGTTT